MSLITSEESQIIWDSRTSIDGLSCKCYNSETKDSSTFDTYLFRGVLNGFQYKINSKEDGVSVTHSSSATTIETNIKAYLETLEKVVSHTHSKTEI